MIIASFCSTVAVVVLESLGALFFLLPSRFNAKGFEKITTLHDNNTPLQHPHKPTTQNLFAPTHPEVEVPAKVREEAADNRSKMNHGRGLVLLEDGPRLLHVAASRMRMNRRSRKKET